MEIQNDNGVQQQAAELVIAVPSIKHQKEQLVLHEPIRAEELSFVGAFDVDWLTEPAFKRMLDNFASSPGAFRTVRTMCVLNSGTRKTVAPTDSGNVWTRLEDPINFSATFNGFEALTSRGLIPFVTLGFFPKVLSDSPVLPPTSWDYWKILIRSFFDQLVADPRFGEHALRSWWFEVWNEPNITAFWEGNFAQYLELYRATSEVVSEAGYQIRLGGPAIAYLPLNAAPHDGASLMRTFLHFISNEPGIKCDFISFHQKGTWYADSPMIECLVEAGAEIANMALTIDPPRFRGITIINNEADMKVGFEIPYEPRMHEQYPTWLSSVLIVYDILNKRFSNAGIRFCVGSENADLQLVEECFDGRRSVMTKASKHTQDLFKVPAYNFYEILRLLGRDHGIFISGSEYCYPNTDLFHVATVDSDHLCSIFSVYPLRNTKAHSWELNYMITTIPWQKVNVIQFQIDNNHSNSYTASGRMLSTPFPAPDKARVIRDAQELTVSNPPQHDVLIEGGAFHTHFIINPMTVVVYWITPFLPDVPISPRWVKAIVEDANVVLQWEPTNEPFFYSYEVYLMASQDTDALLSKGPLRAALWVDTDPPKGIRTYGVCLITASGIRSSIIRSTPIYL